MKAIDIKIGLVKYEEEGYKPYWKGFLIYKDVPVFEVIGNQLEGQYGDYIPLNFVQVEGEEVTQDKKKCDIGMFNIRSFKNKTGDGYTFTMDSNVELFNMKFPLKGFIGFKNNAKTVRLECTEEQISYYQSDDYLMGCIDKKKQPIELILENPGTDYTERDLSVMLEAYPEFPEWYKSYIESSKIKKATSTRKMIMPSAIAAPTKAPY
jgi:hypothetical protein